MKLSTMTGALSLITFGLGVTAFGVTQGCSSDSTSSGGAVAGRQPPAKPSAAAANLGDERTFAVYSLQLGETDRAGVKSTSAWKDFGYNLDGLVTTKESADVCTRVKGAASTNQEDGKEGIDNAFGSIIIPFIDQLQANPSKTLSDNIQNGTFTILLTVKGLTDDPAQTNTDLAGEILIGGSFADGGKPTFTKSDDWPYRADPRVALPGAYITNGTFVNGAGTTVKLSLLIGGVSLDLSINKAILTFAHSKPDELSSGTIAGVIATDELLKGIEKVAGRLSTALCTGSSLESIKNSLKQASDIMVDGTNRPGVECNGISVGIGFTAKRIGPPKTLAKDEPAPPDPCLADGGK